MKFDYLIILILVIHSPLHSQCFTCKNAPFGTIFCDDFDENMELDKKYFEINTNNGDFVRLDKVGRDNSFGMRVKWQKAEVSAGGLSKSFGRTPDTYIGKNAAMPNSDFDEIYWRIDVKAQEGWMGGGPAKLSRALCLANSNWAEGMMAHLWSGGQENLYLGMDPASGIGTNGVLKSTKYNDFPNLRWLGFKSGNIDMFSSANSGRWFCVVAHVKLNSPGQKDGIFEFWINDTLQASSKNLDWHSTWNNDSKNFHINAIFFENYWNEGSPVEQERYFDNIVISTKPIECKCISTKSVDIHWKNEIQVQYLTNERIVLVRNQDQILGSMFETYNLNGEILIEGVINNSSSIINLSHLPQGLYFLKLANEFVYRFAITN